jgi:hypothetical protein
MWVLRTDWEGTKMCAEAHVQMLARDWGPPISSGSARPKRSHHLHVTPRHHHLHLPLHAAHN